ncbi:hypothetical protein C8J57DRAFT_1514770 [Mycena rebaudengoi]|nr:hypothetical protein C8J57DRAFT_1514770 [Mycena rebaudengoi]
MRPPAFFARAPAEASLSSRQHLATSLHHALLPSYLLPETCGARLPISIPTACAVQPFFARPPAAAPVSSHQHLTTPYGDPLLPLQLLVMPAAPVTPFPPPHRTPRLFLPAPAAAPVSARHHLATPYRDPLPPPQPLTMPVVLATRFLPPPRAPPSFFRPRAGRSATF